MQKHLDLVGLFFSLAALISALVAAAVFLLGLGALSLAWEGSQVAASVTGATFIVSSTAVLG